MWRNKFVAITALVLAACQATSKDERFLIYSHGDVDFGEVDRVRTQLGVGLSALRKVPVQLYENRFPITVHLESGNGVSNSAGGQGPITFYGVGRRYQAIIHELTHVLTGYKGRGGDVHWSSEGFATYMQDEHSRRAYPTRKQSHELAKLIIQRGLEIPMTDLMQARNRMSYFGLGADAWTRWRAYALSASFTRFLIEQHGIKQFIQMYGRRSSSDQLAEIERIYGRPAKETIAAWKRFLAGLDTPMGSAERSFNFFSRTFR